MSEPFRLIHGDCFEAMAQLEENSIDSIITDPPYGLSFLGKEWDRLDWQDASALGGKKLNLKSMSAAAPEREGSNPTCSQCGGRARGEKRCECDAPEWIVAGETIAEARESRHKRMQNWHQAWATQAIRILKPGGHIISFGGSRTYHRLACALEDAGFEIRDCVSWIYGTGFPKSRDISKAIDKEDGLADQRGYIEKTADLGFGGHRFVGRQMSDTPVSPDAIKWNGWGTCLKPSWEPAVMARKPFFPATVAANVIKHGTGALNIESCRNEENGNWPPNVSFGHAPLCGRASLVVIESPYAGDVAANVEYARRCMADSLARGEHPVASHLIYPQVLDDTNAAQRERGLEAGLAWAKLADTTIVYADRGVSQGMERGISAARADGRRVITRYLESPERDQTPGCWHDCPIETLEGQTQQADDARTAADRFFYVPKPDERERHNGLYGMPTPKNIHPTVKPIALMVWLCRLVTPPGGTVLDPFLGSGSTGIAAIRSGFKFIGIEREAEYIAIAKRRMEEDAPLFTRDNVTIETTTDGAQLNIEETP